MTRRFQRDSATARASWRSIVAASAVLTLLLAACGGDDGDGAAADDGDGTEETETDTDTEPETDEDEGSAEPDGDADEVSLNIGWWGGESRHALKNELVDMFEDANPHITVEREFAGWDAYWERLPTQLAGGNLPDVLFLTERQVGDFEQDLLDLRPYVEDGTLDLGGYPDAFIDGGVVDDRLVMVLVGGTIPAAQYNTQMFDDLGIDHPSFEWTWDEFHDIAVQIADATDDDVWGTDDSGGSGPLFDTYLMQRGLSLFDFGAGTLNFEESDLAGWLALWDDLREAGAAPPGEVTAEMAGAPFEDSLFARNQTGMYYMNHNQMPIFQEHVEGEMHIAMAPVAGDGEPAALLLGTYLAVAADTEHPEEAIALIDYWLNNDEAIVHFNAEYGGPGNARAYDVLDPDPVLQRVLDFSESVEDISILAGARPQGGLAMENIILRANEAVALGMDVDQAAEQYYAEMEAAIGG